MRHGLLILLAAVSCWSSSPGAFAQEVQRVEVRAGVRLPYFAAWKPNAVATLVLFPGGGGGFGGIGADRWPTSNNFLVRTASMFAERPFNIVIVGRASDTASLENEIRVGAQHLGDSLALLRDVKRHSPAPIWLVGTSRGTVSATAATINDPEALVAGLVLTASIVNYRTPGAVPTQDLAAIKVPTLVVHHANDQCRVCAPSETSWIMAGLKSTPVKARLLVSGGEDQAEGNPCEALHTHGFRGIERKVVDSISDWVLNPTSF